MKNANNIKNELTIAWVKNGFKKTIIKVGKNYKVAVTPCDIESYQQLVEHQKKVKDDPFPYFGYFLVESCELPWLGGSDLDKVCADLARYDELVSENDSDRDKLIEYRAKMLAQEALEDFQNMFDWYSDWHKDVYGYRPHGDAELNAKFSELKNRAVA